MTSAVDVVVYLVRQVRRADVRYLEDLARLRGEGAVASTIAVVAARRRGRRRPDRRPGVRRAARPPPPREPRRDPAVRGRAARGGPARRDGPDPARGARRPTCARSPRWTGTVVEELLLSVDRFRRPSPVRARSSAHARAELLDRLGMFGVRTCLALLRGNQLDAAGLTTELSRRSGVDELRRSLDVAVEGRDRRLAQDALGRMLDLVEPDDRVPEVAARRHAACSPRRGRCTPTQRGRSTPAPQLLEPSTGAVGTARTIEPRRARRACARSATRLRSRTTETSGSATTSWTSRTVRRAEHPEHHQAPAGSAVAAGGADHEHQVHQPDEGETTDDDPDEHARGVLRGAERGGGIPLEHLGGEAVAQRRLRPDDRPGREQPRREAADPQADAGRDRAGHRRRRARRDEADAADLGTRWRFTTDDGRLRRRGGAVHLVRRVRRGRVVDRIRRDR